MSMDEVSKPPTAASPAPPQTATHSGKDEHHNPSSVSSETDAPATTLNGTEPATRRRNRRAYLVFGVAVATGLAAWGGYALLTRNVETTDDAFVEADVVALSPRVGGQVLRVDVIDNQLVQKDDVLIEIDPAPYQARVKQAEADVAVAQANAQAAEAEVTISTASAEGGRTAAQAGVRNATIDIGGADAQVSAADASLERSEAQVREAEADLERARQLAKSGAIPDAELDHREREAEVARAQLSEAKARLSLAQEQARIARSRVAETKGRLRQNEPVSALLGRSKAQLELARARVKSAEASLDLARIDFEGTRVVAAATGRVTRLATRPGQMVQPGQLLLYLVPEERYVVANFKETQVGRVQPGQAVEIEADAYPGRVFRATIDSLMAGTGSRFSLLPADNATGNFVKVVQRIPVRIAWEGEPPGVMLAPGMSVFVKVHVGDSTTAREGSQ